MRSKTLNNCSEQFVLVLNALKINEPIAREF